MIAIAFNRHDYHLAAVAENCISATASVALQQPFGSEILFSEGSFQLYEHALNQLIAEKKTASKEVGVILNNEMALVKRVPVALGLSEEAIEDHLCWEARQFVISDLDDYKFMHQRLPSNTVNGNPYYLIVLVRKALLSAVRKLIQSADLQLCDIDIEAFSIIRTTLSNYSVSEDQKIAIIQIGKQTLTITLIVNGDYFLTNRVDMAGASHEESDIGARTVMIQKELKRTIFGHRLGQGVDDLNALYLIGNGHAQATAQALSESVSVPVHVLNPFHRIQVSEALSGSDDFMRNSERYAAPVGLLLKRCSKILKT